MRTATSWAIRSPRPLTLPILGALGALMLGACVPPPAPAPADPAGAPRLAADTGPAGETVGAARITRADQLIGGPSASGRVGDYVLYNERIQVIISDLGHGGGGAASGGNVMDADLRRGGHDELAEVFTWLDATFPRQLIYDQIAVTHGGADGSRAEIAVSGRDSLNAMVKGVTRYILEPGATHLKIVTELTNTSVEPLPEYEMGDAIQWGRTQAFVPGYGRELAGKHTQAPWVAGLGDGVSYGFTAMGVTLRGPHGNGWSDVVVARADLAPGAVASWERYLTVGDGDIASMLPALHAIRGEVSEEVSGTVVEESGDARIAGAVVTASSARSGRPFAVAHTDDKGAFRLQLPPDEYQLDVRHRSRQSLGAQRVDLTQGAAAPARLTMSAPGRLRYAVTEAGGGAMPAKIALVGLGETASPDLGPRYATAGALNYVLSLTGSGEIEIPPGTYEVTASRGIEYAIASQELSVAAGQAVSFTAALAREVDTAGYLSADLHQATYLSPDCAVSPEDALIANLAEGVEVMVAADENVIPDLSAARAALGITDLHVIPGVTVVSPKVGAVTVYPRAPQPGAPAGGAPTFEGASAAQILASLTQGGGIVQVDHPREGATEGYFDIHALDPAGPALGDESLSLQFNAIEVFNGKRLKSASTVLRDWFLLLNQGYAFTAVGGSDSRSTVTQERGYPRTFIGAAASPRDVTDDALVAGLRDHRDVVVTNGPFIRLSAHGAPIGSLVPARGGRVRLDLTVTAPRWIQVDRVEIVANGEVIRTLEATAPDGVEKLKTSEEFALTQDTWFVVVARGSRGMDPVVPQYKGTTITPLGFTNPIWVDVDLDGAFAPPTPGSADRLGYVDVPLRKAQGP